MGWVYGRERMRVRSVYIYMRRNFSLSLKECGAFHIAEGRDVETIRERRGLIASDRSAEGGVRSTEL